MYSAYSTGYARYHQTVNRSTLPTVALHIDPEQSLAHLQNTSYLSGGRGFSQPAVISNCDDNGQQDILGG